MDESLGAGDVCRVWLVWCGAAEAALADASRFAGGLCLPGAWFWCVIVHGFV